MILDGLYFIGFRFLSDMAAKPSNLFRRLSENLYTRALAHYVCIDNAKPIKLGKQAKFMGNTFYVVYHDKWKDQTFRVVFTGTENQEEAKREFLKVYPYAEIKYFDNVLELFTSTAYAIQKVEET